jgi:large subunit ribosomal protein L29
MSLPSIVDIKTLDDNQLNLLIIETRKEILNLRLKQATFESFKPHSFKHAKHKLAQLLTIQSQRQLKIDK